MHDLFNLESSVDYGHILMENFSPDGVEAGYLGHFTSVFITEMWANFGWIGVICGPLWVGFVIYTVHCLFLRGHKVTIISLAFYAHVSVLGFGYVSDFMRFYYPVNVILIYMGPLLILGCIGSATKSMRRIPRKHYTDMSFS